MPETDLTPRQQGARLHQFVRYLTREFPVAFPVTVRIGPGPRNKDGTHNAGESWRVGSAFFIQVKRYADVGDMVDTLVHEWAHLRGMKHAHVEVELERRQHPHHDAAFGVAYAEIYSDLWDGDGWEDSKLC